jgi:predicted transcriptional regulator
MATRTEQRLHVNTWVEPELVGQLDEKAAAADRSRSAEIRVALRQHVDADRSALDPRTEKDAA